MTTATNKDISKNQTIISTSQEFESIFQFFSPYTNKEFRKNVCDIIDQKGWVTVDHSINPEKHKWDGLLTIHFLTPPSAQEIVKLLKEANNPNDFGMNNNKTLYLWWD